MVHPRVDALVKSKNHVNPVMNPMIKGTKPMLNPMFTYNTPNPGDNPMVKKC